MADARDRLGAGAEQSGAEAKGGLGDWISGAMALIRWLSQSLYSFLGMAATLASGALGGTIRLGIRVVRAAMRFRNNTQSRRIGRAQRLLDQRGRAAKRWARSTIRAADQTVKDAETRAVDHVNAVQVAVGNYLKGVKFTHDQLVSEAEAGRGPLAQAELERMKNAGITAKSTPELRGAITMDVAAAERNRTIEICVASFRGAVAIQEAKSAASAYTANVRSEADNLKKEVVSAHDSYARATDANMHALEQLGERRRPRVFRESLKSITQDQASHRSAFTGSVASASERLQNAWSAVPKDTTRVDSPSPVGGVPDKPLMEYSSKNPSNRNWFNRARTETRGNRAIRTLTRNQKRNNQKTGPTR